MSRVSENNRVLDYMNFTKADGVIAEYVDYLAFYGSYFIESLVVFIRDNDAGMNLHGFHFTKFPTKNKFILKAQKYYKGEILDMFQLKEMTIEGKPVMKVDIYGKGLLVMNRENLREDFELCLQYFGLVDTLTLTRIDYAVDCSRICWTKKHTLNTKLRFEIKNQRTGQIEYIGFGKKGVSPQFLRYYNKKLDLKVNNAEWLYPEYEKFPEIIRYELQVNSDGIAQDEKKVYFNYLKHICNLGLSCSKNKRSHHKHKVIDREFIMIQRKIIEYQRERNFGKLSKIFMMMQGFILNDDMNNDARVWN